MRKVAAVVAATVLSWALLEGVVSIYRGGDPHTSVVSNSLAIVRRGTAPVVVPVPRGPGPSTSDDDWIFNGVLQSSSELENLINELKQSGVALGNSPYVELRDPEVALNYTGSDGCVRQKPNVKRYVGYLRSTRWFNFDPISFFYEDPNRLTPQVASFLQRYALRTAVYTTNKFEERTTMPVVTSTTKVLIAGDSVAAGAIIDDTETVASHLQGNDSTRQFINVGINGADANDVFCTLERERARLGGEIAAVVYIWCENDFDGEEPYRDPQAAVKWLADFASRMNVKRVVLVYSPYVYNTVPEVTRIEHLTDERPTYFDQFRVLKAAALEAGFSFLNVADVVAAVRTETRSHFGPLALYVDHAHLSNRGSELVAREIARHLP